MIMSHYRDLCPQLPVVRYEQERTFFYSTESQEAKSEVLSILAISDGAVQELVIAGAKLVYLKCLSTI